MGRWLSDCASPRTIEVHRSNLMRKLGLHTHTDLIRYALQRGIGLCSPKAEQPKRQAAQR